jgi:hypothetical protein
MNLLFQRQGRFLGDGIAGERREKGEGTYEQKGFHHLAPEQG